MAKAIRVVVLARAKVDKGSGLRTRKDEEKGGLRETAFYEPTQGRFLYASYLGRGYIHQSCDKVVSPYESPKRDKTSWRLTGRGESPTRKEVKVARGGCIETQSRKEDAFLVGGAWSGGKGVVPTTPRRE
jgi:hypothetical protein